MLGFPNAWVSKSLRFWISQLKKPCTLLCTPCARGCLACARYYFYAFTIKCGAAKGRKKKDVPYEVKQLSKVNEAKVSAGGKAGGVGRAPA